MADNIIIPTQGTGDSTPTVATDDVGGAHYQRVKPDFGGDGAAQAVTTDAGVSDAGTQRVVLASDQAVAADPQSTHATDTAISAGGQATLDSDQINSGKTGVLLQLLVSSSLPLKAEVRTVLNGVASGNLAVRFGTDIVWEVPRGFVTVAEDVTAGLDGFRVVITNLDTSESADVYATFLYDEV